VAFRPDFRIEVSRAGTTVTIALAGELDAAASVTLAERFSEAIVGHDFEQLIFDMQQISFIDSAGIRAIILIERAAREKSVPLVVINPQESVTELLRTTGVIERLTVGPARETRTGGELDDWIELELPCDPTAPGRARAEVREAAVAHLSQDETATAILLTSELVTNAVVHPEQRASTPISLRIGFAEARIRIEVTDRGSGFDPVAPTPRKPDRGGRGLLLVDRLADRWGAGTRGEHGDPRFCVWFELNGAGEEARRPAAPA
jgi:serine/threonine-protein kinase RsbW